MENLSGKGVKNKDDFPIPYHRLSEEAANTLQRETTSPVKYFLHVFADNEG